MGTRGLTIRTLARLLRARQISSEELTRSALAELDRRGRSLNAVAELIVEPALAAARRADIELKRGAPRSLLHGIPYGVKDLIDTAGIPTRCGAEPYRDRVPRHDATVVRRMQSAGAILVAKLAMVALAGAGLYRSTRASITGPGINPWNPGHWSGGSSSGSASAVAAGLLTFSIGSETRGSIVVPAAFCGVTGLRPTYGVVSRSGVMPTAWSMDKLGPIARSADDCAIVLAAIGGRDESDPTSVEWGLERRRARRRSRRRFGILPFEAGQDVRDAFRKATDVLDMVGTELTEAALPPYDYARISQTIVAAETAATYESFINSPLLDELCDEGQRDGLRSYLEVSAREYARALEERVAATRAIDRALEDIDALLAPTVPFEAPPLDADLADFPRLGYAVLGAVAGVPSLTLPIGFGASGLPLGISLIAARYREDVLVRAGTHFQRASSWHRLVPVDAA